MKIAVYTIAKNEEQFVRRWAESCAEADYRLILDTGSTDNTWVEAHKHNVAFSQRVFDPWRFDYARNHALSIIPDDIDLCIALDMDEVLQPGWRQALETMPPGVTRPRYKYVWSWNEDGTEGLVYGGDKIHARHGYYWEHPVHEVLKPKDILEQQHWTDGLEIHHHPDPTKSRAQYLDLLKLAVEEKPHDDRNQFYLAREYFYKGEHGLAQYHFSQHLMRSNWAAERAANHRFVAKMRPYAAETILYKAISEDPTRRESWADLAAVYYHRQDWERCLAACQMAFAIKTKPLDYLCETYAWGPDPYDMAAVSAYHLGNMETAWEYGVEAVALNPNDERLRANLDHYRL